MGSIVRCTDFPTAVAHYSEYREHLRRDFWFSCAYCTTAEAEATGIGFEIDHYVPSSRATTLVACYTNLMWCCEHCNGLKRDHPSPEASAAGFRFFNPDTDAFEEHFESAGTRVSGRTCEVGTFTERVLMLNRKPLQEIRAQRARIAAAQHEIAEGLRALRGMALDALSKENRKRVLAKMATLEARASLAGEEIVDFMLRELNRSPLLDRDPNAGAIAKERRRFLDSCNAVTPRATIPPPPTDEQQERKKVAKRRAAETRRKLRVRRP
jgi:hypothetical protein